MRRGLPLLVFAACLGAAAPASAAYRYAGAWGGEGYAAGLFGTGREVLGGDRQFNSPGGLAVDRAGHVFVADTSNNRIQVFSPEGSYLKHFGRYGFDPGASRRVAARGRFILPQGLALDSRGNLFVADNRNDRVVKLRRGRFVRRIGRRGSLPGTMTSPWGIAVRGGVVYVVDQGNTRISRYSTAGRFLGSFGRFGTTPGRLRAPYGIAVRRGIVYVSDSGRDQIDTFTLHGRYLGSIGARGSGEGEFDQPSGLTFDSAGKLLVADCANQRIQRLEPDGTFIESFGSGDLRDPTFVATGRGGTVYVSDYREIKAFVPTADPPQDPAGGVQDTVGGILDGLFGDGSGGGDQGGGVEPPGRLACVSQAESAYGA
jgi:DNA-binding beta-propeller fold protein YncE